MKGKIGLLACLVLLTGCCTTSGDIAQSSYNYATSVGKEYLVYVDNDMTLSVDQKQLRHDRQESHVKMLQESLGVSVGQ